MSALLLAFLAGAAEVLAFAPLGLFPLGIAAYAVLIDLWMRATPAEAFRAGAAFGAGLFGAGVSWVYVSLTQFGGMPPALGILATFLFCALLCVFPAGAGWLQARIPCSPAIRAWVVIPASWVVFEWLRGWVFTGFPWLSAGYAATGWPLQGFGPLLGVYGLSFATLALSGMAWSLARRVRRLHAAAAAIALLALGQALRLPAYTTPAGEPFSAALLQGNVPQDLKFEPARYAQILERYARLVEDANAKLIVLPETALPRFLDNIEPDYLQRLRAAARRGNGDLLVGVPYRERTANGVKHYNSVLSLGASPPQIYHKVHLVPFGEFVPPGFRWTLNMLSIPLSDFDRGAPAQPPHAVAGQRVAVNVCYEDAFGDEIAARAREATLLVNASNVAWFGDSLAPAQHLQIARMRAIETGRMHLAATNTGVTAAIDRDGSLVAVLPQFVEGRLEVRAQGYTGLTPYMRYRDWPVLALALGVLGAAVLVARRRSR